MTKKEIIALVRASLAHAEAATEAEVAFDYVTDAEALVMTDWFGACASDQALRARVERTYNALKARWPEEAVDHGLATECFHVAAYEAAPDR